ncbi:MAG: hypothetical protein WAW23_07080 [Candidatus Methanoperedens sp.]
MDQDEFMIDDPIDFNDAVIGFFKTKYAEQIESVFIELRERADSKLNPWLGEILSSMPRRLIERQIFPIFAAASSSGGLTRNHLKFCSAFVRAVSLPNLRIDFWIDQPATKKRNIISMSQIAPLAQFCLNNDGFSDLYKLPNAKKIMELIVSNNLKDGSSQYYEMMHRYDIDYLSNPKKNLELILNSPFSPLTSMYFSTTIQASILLNSKTVDNNAKRFTEHYGRLRQLVDQINDVEEDITMGNITIPILYALLENDNRLEFEIKNLWAGIQGDESDRNISVLSIQVAEIKELVQKLGGFECAYRMADRLYNQTIGLASKCLGRPGIDVEVMLLIRLTRAYLERLKLNNWADIPNYY